MEIVKTIHVTCAILTMLSFAARGAWMLMHSPMLQKKAVKIAPHVIDTVLLLSGVILVVEYYPEFHRHDWLLAKLVTVVLYILSGSIAISYGRTLLIRTAALIASFMLLAVILGLVMTRSLSFGY